MARKKINPQLILLGLAFESPLDEAIVTASTGGVGAITAPVQTVVSSLFGLYLILKGFGVL